MRTSSYNFTPTGLDLFVCSVHSAYLSFEILVQEDVGGLDVSVDDPGVALICVSPCTLLAGKDVKEQRRSGSKAICSELTVFVQVRQALGGAERDGEPPRPVHHRHALPCTQRASITTTNQNQGRNRRSSVSSPRTDRGGGARAFCWARTRRRAGAGRTRRCSSRRGRRGGGGERG